MKIAITNQEDFGGFMQCDICSGPLSGKQSKFCSDKCASKGQHNASYANQQKRGLKRKTALIDLLGGKCQHCGYNKCVHALTFHHKDPAKKSFQLDIRSCSNRGWAILEEEAQKCELLCFNCHMEHHWQ
jgi:predicted nucleic acid-binding Zn ribbon protein